MNRDLPGGICFIASSNYLLYSSFESSWAFHLHTITLSDMYIMPLLILQHRWYILRKNYQSFDRLILDSHKHSLPLLYDLNNIKAQQFCRPNGIFQPILWISKLHLVFHKILFFAKAYHILNLYNVTVFNQSIIFNFPIGTYPDLT